LKEHGKNYSDMNWTKEVIECLHCGQRQWALLSDEIHICHGCKISIPQNERVLCWTEEEMELKEWENDKA
jgi:hypothetical protein